MIRDTVPDLPVPTEADLALRALPRSIVAPPQPASTATKPLGAMTSAARCSQCQS